MSCSILLYSYNAVYAVDCCRPEWCYQSIFYEDQIFTVRRSAAGRLLYYKASWEKFTVQAQQQFVAGREAQFGESMSWKLLAGRFQIKDIKVLTLLHCISQHHVVAFQKNGVSFEDCLLFSTAMDSKRVVAWECLVWWSYGHGVLGLQWKLNITKLFRLILLPKWIGAVWRFFVKMSLFRDSKMWNHFRWWGKCF